MGRVMAVITPPFAVVKGFLRQLVRRR